MTIPSDFRQAMRRLAATVSIVTSADHTGWYGIAATAVTSVCAEPPTLLVCVNRRSSLSHPLADRGRFCVNLLRCSQSSLSQAFGGGLGADERFLIGDWSVDDDRIPYLIDAQANLFCDVDKVIPYRTHDVVFGLVDGVRIFDQVSPLIYQDGSYATTSVLREFA